MVTCRSTIPMGLCACPVEPGTVSAGLPVRRLRRLRCRRPPDHQRDRTQHTHQGPDVKGANLALDEQRAAGDTDAGHNQQREASDAGLQPPYQREPRSVGEGIGKDHHVEQAEHPAPRVRAQIGVVVKASATLKRPAAFPTVVAKP